ncbi:DNA repair protein endonuclease SAE2/CtIP C-terminus-domain-containing protein [Biscogniauxia mediterranea]|nr:DNA repair protein endonuclease SAE2/CtIP C-terminus-domain-containing protein [Biscogniauxia mediterranea]
MENWFRDTGRSALFEALTEVCDQLSNDFDAGIRTLIQDRTELASELDSLKQTASSVSRLEKENRILQSEIDKLKKTSRLEPPSTGLAKPGDANGSIRTPLAPKSVNLTSSTKRPDKPQRLDIDALKLVDLKKEYWKLESNYAKLHDKYKELEDAHAESTRLLRERTTVYHQWVNHAKKLNEQAQNRSRKIKKLEAKLAEVTRNPLLLSFDSDTENVQPTEQRERSIFKKTFSEVSGDITLARLDNVSRSPSALPPPLGNNDREPRSSTEISRVSIPMAIKSREARNDRQQINDQEDEEEDDEAPSLPPLLRNKSVSSQVFIKSEPSSDTPVVVSERSLRKRKHGDDEPATAVPSRVKTEHSSDPLIFDEQRRFSASESVDFDFVGQNIQTPRKRNKSHRKPESRYANVSRVDRASPEVDDLANRRPVYGTTTDGQCDGYNDSGASENGARALFEEDAVNNLPKSRSNPPPILHHRTVDKDGRGRLSAIPPPKRGKSSSISRGSARHMEASDVDDTVLEGAQSNDVPTMDLFQFELPPRRQLPFDKSGSKRARNSVENNSKPVNSEPEQTPTVINPRRSLSAAAGKKAKADKAAPLRELPRSELRLGHFKINPAANEGYDYAFTDVVRNKEHRAALQGCINETCCGPMFRSLAKRSRESTGASAFQALLESYLGDECYKLSTMSDSEKEQLWIKAKMIELANLHGKHRHRYQRMTTPPGFWRTDFPSTQEGEQDRREAAKLEQDMIEERYREALRPGGRWLFRDE